MQHRAKHILLGKEKIKMYNSALHAGTLVRHMFNKNLIYHFGGEKYITN